jgi:hypothetical protein
VLSSLGISKNAAEQTVVAAVDAAHAAYDKSPESLDSAAHAGRVRLDVINTESNALLASMIRALRRSFRSDGVHRCYSM